MRWIAVWALIIAAGIAAPAVKSTLDTGSKIPVGPRESVEVINAGKMKDPQLGEVYWVKYKTARPIADAVALRNEVDGLWARVKQEAERLDIGTVLLTPTADSGPKSASGEWTDFVVRKKDDRWTVAGPKDGPRTLTKPLMEQVLRQWDATTANMNIDGSLLYFEPGWSCQMTERNAEGVERTRKIDLTELERTGRDIVGMLTNYKSDRTGTTIDIAADGQTAAVTSRITETMWMNTGGQSVIVSDTIDVFELVDGRPLIKSSTQHVIEARQQSEPKFQKH